MVYAVCLDRVVRIAVSNVYAFSPFSCAHALCHLHPCCVIHMQGGLVFE